MTLDAYLTKHSISGADFAALLGISEASLSRIRAGKQNITRELMRKIVEHSKGKVSLTSLVFPTEQAAA